jgi:diguanylate cyclase (GGDEF)-like protein
MFISVKKGKLPCYQRLIMLGGVLYVLADILYYYIYIFSTYTPNSLLDAVYVSGFCLIAVAGITKLEKKEENTDVNPYHNIDKNINVVTLMIAPVCVLVFQRDEIQYIWLLIIIIMFYYVISNYVQKNIYKDVLLNREKEITKQLEDKVFERTQELIKKNKELDRLLNLDIITNLHNRRYLYHKLNEWILQRKNAERILTLYIDVNHHKMIKMMYGNYISEKILAEAAVKLKNIVEKYQSTTLATYSEDSFVVAMKGLYGYNNGIELANEIITELSTLYKVDDYEIQVTLNIGISILPLDAKTEEELIKHADIATSQARMLGFNKIFAFNMQLGEEIDRKNRIEMMLKRVNMDEEFQLFYQPQVDTIDSKVIGFEALIRWITKENEFISPADFIPIAEETGYIIPIGEWVMKKALHTLAKWNRNSATKYRMGINVSMKQLVGNHFILSLKEEMDSLKIPSEWIDIEITETIQFEENQHIIELLKEFRRMGVSVSIDDFGTGYSSFYYLNRLPINRVKVAKELIDNIVHDNFDYQLVHSLIKVSKIRGIKVIAEGVETADQLECLKELNCDEIQGYYFSKPMKELDIQDKYINAEVGH